MKKTLKVLALFLFVLPLCACSVDGLQNDKNSHLKKQNESLVLKNQKTWNKRIKNADLVKVEDQTDNNHVGLALSLDELNNFNKAVIKGTVLNLEKMNSPENMALTKVSVQVDSVISGDDSLKGRIIYLALSGGVVSFDRYYANSYAPKDQNHELLVKNDNSPLPSIGSQIITGVVSYPLNDQSEYNNSLKQSGFNAKNSYAISFPQYNLWIKKSGQKEYVLNNPKISKKSSGTDELALQLKQLTKEINQKYNKKTADPK